MPFRNNYLHIKNEEGSGLILALMTLMVLSVLGASLGAITIGSYKLGDVNRDDTSAYYIAEAGANMAYEEMKTGVLGVHEEKISEGIFFDKVNDVADDIANRVNSINNYYKFKSQFGDTPNVTINISKEPGINSRKYVIESTGEVGGNRRTVEKNVEVTLIQSLIPEKAAIISKGNIDFKPNASVKGNVIVLDKNSITLNGNKNICSDNDKDCEDYIQGEVLTPIQNWDKYELLAKSFPNESEFTKQLGDTTTNQKVTINLSDSDNLFFKTTNLDLGNLKINGNGTVNIFVGNNLSFNGDNFNLDNDFRNVRIFYAGNTVDINKDYKFNASLFVKDGSISIGNKVSFNGVLLYGGEKEIEIGVHDELLNSYLIAPFSKIILRNHAEFKGTVIAGSVEIDNQSTVNYNPIDSFPFSINGIGSGGEGSGGEVITSEPVVESD